MQEKLTDEQRKLVEENYNLIYGFCNLHKINKDEYSDILSLALCESAMRFDETKGITFASYTYRLMSNRMKNEEEYLYAKFRIPKELIISENNVDKNKYEDVESLFDIIASADNVEDLVVCKCMLEDIKTQENLLSDNQKRVLDYLLYGLNTKEMQLALNISYRYTQKLRQITKNKIESFIVEEYQDN